MYMYMYVLYYMYMCYNIATSDPFTIKQILMWSQQFLGRSSGALMSSTILICIIHSIFIYI